ncbi:MAG: helix-turn-helix domain-containing protein [Clostridia bacterium]|nr:helix-turn-helix domain-containing protein [Clostridia bacterium]
MIILKKEAQIANDFISASRKAFSGNADPHIHEFFELEYIIAGGGTCVIDGREYPMHAGTLFLLTPANTHAVRNADADMINIMFKCEYDNPAFSLPVLYAPAAPPFLLTTADRPLMLALLSELVQVHETHIDYARTLLTCVMQKLSCYPRTSGAEPMPYIQHALLYVTENFRNGITLADTAAHLGLSVTYLSELFARQTGMNFKTYLDRVRFSHVQNLLTFTDIPVCAIHEYAGFRDYANFSRRFRRLYGMTPGEYRKKRQTV